MTLRRRFCHVVLVGCFVWSSIGQPLSAAIADQIALRPAPPEVEAFVREVIRDRFGAGDIPDIGLVVHANPTRIAIREEMPGAGLRLTSSALPERGAVEFALVSLQEAQEMANRTRQNVYFIAVDRPEIGPTSATVVIGGDFTMPIDPKAAKMCCCESRAHYVKNGDQWTFAKWVPLRCG